MSAENVQPLCLDTKHVEQLRKHVEKQALLEKVTKRKATEIWYWVQSFSKLDVYQKLPTAINLYKTDNDCIFIDRDRNYLRRNNGDCYHTLQSFMDNCNIIPQLYDHIQSGQVYETIKEIETEF